MYAIVYVCVCVAIAAIIDSKTKHKRIQQATSRPFTAAPACTGANSGRRRSSHHSHTNTDIHTHILYTSSWAYCEIVLATCSFLGTGHNNFWRSRSSQRRRRLKMPWRSLRGQGWDEEYGEGERVRRWGSKGSCEWVSSLPEATTQSNSKAAPRVPALNKNNNNKSTHTNTNANRPQSVCRYASVANYKRLNASRCGIIKGNSHFKKHFDWYQRRYSAAQIIIN